MDLPQRYVLEWELEIELYCYTSFSAKSWRRAPPRHLHLFQQEQKRLGEAGWICEHLTPNESRTAVCVRKSEVRNPCKFAGTRLALSLSLPPPPPLPSHPLLLHLPLCACTIAFSNVFRERTCVYVCCVCVCVCARARVCV